MNQKVSAGSLAKIDQGRTALARLIARVRNHQTDCDVPEARACCGDEVFATLRVLSPDTLQLLVILALAELAAQPAPAMPPALASLDFTPADDADPTPDVAS